MRGLQPGAGAGAGAGAGPGNWQEKSMETHCCAGAGLLLLLGPGMQHRFLDCIQADTPGNGELEYYILQLNSFLNLNF